MVAFPLILCPTETISHHDGNAVRVLSFDTCHEAVHRRGGCGGGTWRMRGQCSASTPASTSSSARSTSTFSKSTALPWPRHSR